MLGSTDNVNKLLQVRRSPTEVSLSKLPSRANIRSAGMKRWAKYFRQALNIDAVETDIRIDIQRLENKSSG